MPLRGRLSTGPWEVPCSLRTCSPPVDHINFRALAIVGRRSWRSGRHLACRGAGHPARRKNRPSKNPVPFAWILRFMESSLFLQTCLPPTNQIECSSHAELFAQSQRDCAPNSPGFRAARCHRKPHRPARWHNWHRSRPVAHKWRRAQPVVRACPLASCRQTPSLLLELSRR